MLVAADYKTMFARDGYVLVEDLFTREEMAAAKQEIRRILDSKRTKDKDGNVPKDNGVFVGITLNSDFFKKLNADPRVLDVLEQCVGPNLEFWSDKVVYKSAGVDFGSPWHQDWPYWKGTSKFSVWIALDDASPENGCLKLIPGSHMKHASHGGQDSDGIGFNNRLRPEDVDESKAIVAPVRAGGAIFFHDLTLHASFPNKSGRDRWALISTYRDASKDDLAYDFAKARFMVRGTKTGVDRGESGR
ncbi:MAG: phytanoyl-CoA dioxygenase family protein [Planctomycetota bacterium]|nr:phytanoyl-CoA dioxygenase family protein [Planctomycetota bacterium]